MHYKPPVGAEHLPTRSSDQAPAPSLRIVGIEYCIFAAVLFNFFLCFVNTNVANLSTSYVVAGEVMILSSSLLLVLRAGAPGITAWMGFLYGLVAWWLILCVLRQQIEPKIVRDVAIIPIFIMLGLSCRRGEIGPMLIRLQAVVLAVMLFETISPERFSGLFNVMRYYVDTRGFEEASFWNGDSDLFVSATRPGERFFPFFGAHRLSSVFLEPVSLGNYVIIITIALVAFRDRMSRHVFWLLATSDVVLLFGCDGRLAFGICLAVIGAAPLLSRIRWIRPAALLPIVMAVALATWLASGETAGQDNLGGRIGVTFEFLASLDLGDLFGLSVAKLPNSLDSGLTYTIISQSLAGATAIWCFLFSRRFEGEIGRRMAYGAAIYLAGTMMVSYSLYSIKTASLFWVLFGVTLRMRFASELSIKR